MSDQLFSCPCSFSRVQPPQPLSDFSKLICRSFWMDELRPFPVAEFAFHGRLLNSSTCTLLVLSQVDAPLRELDKIVHVGIVDLPALMPTSGQGTHYGTLGTTVETFEQRRPTRLNIKLLTHHPLVSVSGTTRRCRQYE